MVEPDRESYQMAYNVVSNSTLWFAHHHLFDAPRRPKIDQRFTKAWDAYREVNRSIRRSHLGCRRACGCGARSGLPPDPRARDPRSKRDPTCRSSTSPTRRSRTRTSCAPFRPRQVGRCSKEWRERSPAGSTSPAGKPRSSRAAKTLACGRRLHSSRPLAPDAAQLTERVSAPEVAEAAKRLKANVGDRRTIVKVDRVEPSKNLLRGFWAFDELLRTRPHWRGQRRPARLVLLVAPGAPEYLAYGTEVEMAAKRVNETWGTHDWTPVDLEIADDPTAPSPRSRSTTFCS